MSAVIVAAPAAAQSDQIRRGPMPDWATPSEAVPVPAETSGPVFVRRQDMVVHLGAKGQAQYVGYRIKLLDPNALQLGNISIAWNPVAGAPIVHAIKVHRDGAVVDALQSAKFEILRREDQLKAARLDGTLTAVLRVPDLRVGDEIEVELKTFASDPGLGNNESGLLALPPSPAPGRYHVGLQWEAGREPKWKVTPDLAAAMTRRPGAVDFRLDNPAPVSPPKDAPLRYHWQRRVEYSDFADWPALSRHFAPLYARAATPGAGSMIGQEAARIAAAFKTPMERAAAALKLVQQDVRYIYVGLDGGNLIPATADETWQRRYGDCKGKTVLLIALLTAMGIEAEPVLLNSAGADDGLDQRLVLPQMFDHVVVRARIDGRAYWLDGTLPAVAGPSERLVFPAGWVLPLTAAGGSIERQAWAIPNAPDELNLFEIDARAGFDKPARIVSTEIVRGVKGLQKQMQFASITSAQLLDAFRQNAIGDTFQTIEAVTWRYDARAAASVLTVTGTGTIQWDGDDDGEKSLALPGGGFSPPERRVRAADANRDAPYWSRPEYGCHVTTVRVPTTTRAEQWSAKPGFDTRMFGRNFYRAWEMRDGAIRMVRGSRIEQPEIDAATAERDNARIGAFDNSMGWITYTPGGKKAGVGTGETVPATYDIDWTGDGVPCAGKRPPA